MAHILADRVLESTTTTGTGALTLAGAVTGFRAFSAVCSVSDTVPYFIEAVDSLGQPTGDYEFGIGTYSAANELTRTTVQGSSNADAAVDFAAGSKNVGIGLLASAITDIEADVAAVETDVAALEAAALTLGTMATLSGVATRDFAIASGAKRVSVNVSGWSTNGTAAPLFQLGDSGGAEIIGYLGASSTITNGAVTTTTNYTTGFGLALGQASNVIHGRIVFELMDEATNLWSASGTFARSDAPSNIITAGSKALSGELTMIRITTANGTDLGDAGNANVLVEF